MVISPGSRLGRYEILYQIGAGGMGKVYFARDPQLGRPVAIKVLAIELTAHKERLHRFEQEARLTSSLNHPNILTIYEIGSIDSTHYIVSEFIEGCTLRHHLNSMRLEITEVLDIGIQSASALAAAHAAGIIHRDIKPENIMLRIDGYVKVLDFGLAKLAIDKARTLFSPEAPTRTFASPEASTKTNFDTDPGAILGTILYMSPEQLRGQEVDARTDIWSLGVVLYEITTGHAPFDGSTKSDAIASILGREPAPPTRYAPNLPTELHRIIKKALRKEREQRYLSIEDLLLDLKQLKRDLELAANTERPARAVTNSDESLLSVNNQNLTTEDNKESPQTDKQRSARSTLSVGSFFNVIEKHQRSSLFFLLMLMLAGGGAYLFLLPMKQQIPGAGQRVEFTKLPIIGNVKEAVISPDGRYIATIIDEAGMQSVWVRQINTSNNLQIVAPAEGQYKGLSFSPEGDYIYYLKEEGDTGMLCRVSVLGGNSRKLISNVDTPITFSPDGSRLAFVRQYGENSTSLILANSEDTEEKKLVTLQQPQSFNLNGFYSSGPAWSPDGSVIACPAFNITGSSHMDVVGVRVQDGSVKPINTQEWSLVERLVWLSDSSGLIMNAIDQSSSILQIWSLSYPNGVARRITNDPNSYVGLSATRDGSTLLTIKADRYSTIWIMPTNKADHAAQITHSEYIGSTGITWTSDGRIVYASNETGNQNIWAMNADGSSREQLTFSDRTNIEPTVSPDGRYIVFVLYTAGKPHLWRMDTNKTNPEQLTNGTYEDMPQFSPDGHWVVYHSTALGKDSIWKVSIDGQDPTLLTKEPSTQPSVSPDGRLIACFSRAESVNSPWRIAIISMEGGAPIKMFNLPATVNPAWPGISWATDNLSVLYIITTGGVSNIWSQPLSGSPPKQLTTFQEDQIFSFASSYSTQQIVCVRWMITRELFLVKKFR